MKKEPIYYVWGQNPFIPGRYMDFGTAPDIVGVSWLKGARIAVRIPTPLHMELDRLPDDRSTWDFTEGLDMLPFMESHMPIFRDDLVKALNEAGVDNIELYDTVITDPNTGKEYTNYKAVNIIGCVTAADMDNSQATVHDNVPLMDVDFDKLVIDETAPRGLLMFRLAESVTTIIVHKKVRDQLLAKGFSSIAFDDPDEIAL